MSVDDLLSVVSVVLTAGCVCSWLAGRLRIPDIALFLLAGILLALPGIDLIRIDPHSLFDQFLVVSGAAYIVFEGGTSIRLAVLKKIAISLVVLVSVGVLLTAGIVGVTAASIFHLPLVYGLLMGAVIAATDPATLIPVFKQITVRERVAQLVMSESALNDPTGAILTMVVLGVIEAHGLTPGSVLWRALLQIGAGGVVGIAVGGILTASIGCSRFAMFREYPSLVTLIAVAGSYLGATKLDGSGYMAAFVTGLIVGNADALGIRLAGDTRAALTRFVDTVSLIARMFIFIALGSQVDFAALGSELLGGIGVVAAFMLLARPVTVFVCCGPDRRAGWTLKELVFLSWVRETGVIPSALAGMLLALGIRHADLIASVTFLAVLATILLQASSTRWLAAKLGLIEPDP